MSQSGISDVHAPLDSAGIEVTHHYEPGATLRLSFSVFSLPVFLSGLVGGYVYSGLVKLFPNLTVTRSVSQNSNPTTVHDPDGSSTELVMKPK